MFPASDRKLKAKYTFSSSKAKEPYARTDYYYDKSWNLFKEIIIVSPDPITVKNTYKYSGGKLVEKRHYTIPQGRTSIGLTESALTLYDKYLYYYPSPGIKIEKHYDMEKNFLEDSAVYTYMDVLLLKKLHYNEKGVLRWSKEYQYDEMGNLTEEKEYPDGLCSVYYYDNGKKIKVREYDGKDSLLVETNFIYKKENGPDVVEEHYSGPYGKFISSKSFFKNGLLIEFIRYHPIFTGQE